MGFFAFDGNNSIFDDLVAQLPNGLVYFKERNIIPAVEIVTYVEQFPSSYSVGTDVDIYINDKFYETKKILPTHALYLKIKPPYGKFTVRTEIDGEPYREEVYYSTNSFLFLNVLSLEYNYDYVELFKMFGNVWDKYLQDDMLFNKIGWFYGFGKPYGWDLADYRRILIGSSTNEQINHLFVNSMTYWSLKELVKSFTGVYPDIFSYRDENGWVIPETWYPPFVSTAQLPLYWNFKDFYLWDTRVITGTEDVATGVDLNGLTFSFQIETTIIDMTFTTTATIGDIVNQINIAYGSVVAANASTHPYAPQPGHVMLIADGTLGAPAGGVIIIKGGTALPLLGFLTTSDDDFIDDDFDIITLYDENFYGNKIDLRVKEGSKEIQVVKTRSSDVRDFMVHKDLINTITHPILISGYVEGTDFNLVEYPTAGSNVWAIEWLSPPINMIGTVDGASGFNITGKTLIIDVDNEQVEIKFSGTDPISIADVVSQINNFFTGSPASIEVSGPSQYVRFDGYAIKIVGGTGETILGFTGGQQVGVPLAGDQYIVIYSYFIKEELIPLCEQNKPAFIKINYYFLEST